MQEMSLRNHFAIQFLHLLKSSEQRHSEENGRLCHNCCQELQTRHH